MNILVFPLFSFLLNVEVWSLECWNADYFECWHEQNETYERMYSCVHIKESAFMRAECKENQCVLAVATFTDKTRVELRFCKIQDDDCEFIIRASKVFVTKEKKLSGKVECSFCNSSMCNDPKYEAKSKNDSKNQNHKEAKSKNGSGIQKHTFPNILILATIFLIINSHCVLS